MPPSGGIAQLWGLSVDEQMILLGVTARSTFFKWKRDPSAVLPRDTLERISYILGVYKALQILLPDELAADEWVKRPNAAPLFGGRSALDRMLSGQVADLFVVRQYLDAQRGGDGYTAFRSGDVLIDSRSGGLAAGQLIDRIAAAGTVSPRIEGRIVWEK